MKEFNFKKSNNLEDAVNQLFNIITILREPGGCPWDRKQTNKSIASSLIDESYEYIDALNKDDIDNEKEEIGDVLINVFMELKIHLDQGDFTPEEVLDNTSQKLLRRHPHVFSDKIALTSEDGLSLWNSVKENQEGKKIDKSDFFSQVPSSLPPLERAYEDQKKMSKVAFDFKDAYEAFDKVKEELDEVLETLNETDDNHREEEIGDLLYSVINLSRLMGIRPNVALNRANNKLRKRFQKTVDIATERNIPIDKEHNKELNDIWDEIKKTH